MIAATNRELKKLVDNGSFRNDLFYRLNVIAFHLPPLSQRKDDIPLFIDYFIKQYNIKYNKNIRDIDPGCLTHLINNNWNGNIRELRNVIERGVILTKGDTIESNVLPDGITNTCSEKEDLFSDVIDEEIRNSKPGEIYKNIINKTEKYLIDYALVKSNNKHIEAADILGIHRNTLYHKLKNQIKESD